MSDLAGQFADPSLTGTEAKGAQPPSRTPDAADLALARVATPWSGLHIGCENKIHAELAQALAAWLAARGIY